MDIYFDENNRFVAALNISEKKGTIKTPVEEVEINEDGIIGDAHAGKWHRQVSLLAQEDVENFSIIDAKGRVFLPGEFAENILTRGIDYKKISILDKVRIGEVELEITQIGKKCHGDGCAIYTETGKCVMPKAGVFARVNNPGKVRKNDKIEYIPRPLKIKVITLSDRASSGIYEDLSGPEITRMLNEFFIGKKWHLQIENVIIPDDKDLLFDELKQTYNDGYDFIFTTGGTGIGKRDITPETVLKFADKELPGIMEYIRVKYGETIPSALLSRGVAAIKEQTIIYTLPGSVKAVKEYTAEILRTIEHSILMINNISH